MKETLTFIALLSATVFVSANHKVEYDEEM